MTNKTIHGNNSTISSRVFQKLEDTLFQENQMLAKLIYDNNLNVILNVGGGDGKSLMDVRYYDMQKLYIGLEDNDELLKLARKKSEDKKSIKFDWGKASELPYADRTFDLVYATNNLIGTISKDKRNDFVKESFRVLRKNGYLMLSSWKKDKDTSEFLFRYYGAYSNFVNISDDHIATNSGYYNRVGMISIMKDYLPDKHERDYVIQPEGMFDFGLYAGIAFKKI
jgi:ubiquinone/menaquinone biosynthesis C-methylase UbiE